MDPSENSKARLFARLHRADPLILDGGLATQLESQGHQLHAKLWSAELILSNPEAIIQAHLAYLESGARIITTASYQATIEGFQMLGLNLAEARKAILKTVELGLIARKQFILQNPEIEIFIAASVGPYGAYLADGSEYTGNYGLSESSLVDFHRERLELLSNSEADLIACETIPDFVEAKALDRLLYEMKKPAWVSFSCRDHSFINDGTALGDAAALFNPNPNVFAVGINCSSPQYTVSLIDVLKSACPDKKIVIYPNSGEMYCPDSRNWDSGTATDNFVASARSWHRQGANIVGGCCRIGPREISDLARQFRNI
jgi:homocysteine S-methyltransferase